MNAPAYRIDGRDASREAFYATACDPARSVVVEACAGAGKTWMLVSRILRALLDGQAPQEILAITFTRKAAGEMRERLAKWLREFADGATDDTARAQELVARGLSPERAAALAPALGTLHARLLEAGRSVEIRTFHGWFTQLLRGAPLALLEEIGLRPDAELLESADDHHPAIWRRFHAALRRDEGLVADHREAIGARGRHSVQRWLLAALDKRIEIERADAAGTLEGSVGAAAARWPELQGLDHPTQRLDAAALAALAALAVSLGQGKTKAQDAARGLVDAVSITDPEVRFEAAWHALFTKDGEPRKLGDIPGLAAAQDDLQRLREQVAQHEAHVEHRRMVRLARVLLAEYAAYKRERGLVDMSDLERCALALLRDATLAGWVQERLDARVRQVLIDEFQDTSPLQWHALRAWLDGYAGAGGGASGQRPPGVFIVGDPKQSIYRFRRAEPRVFAAAGDFVVEALGGHRLACDHTRRNAPEVLAGLNVLFGQAQDEGRYDGFRPHTTERPADAAGGLFRLPRIDHPGRTKTGTRPPPAWRDSLTQPRREPETVRREQEAAQVADAIAALLVGGEVPPGEVFVLCRKRQSLRLLAEALQARHVPHVESEERELGEAIEVRDLVALLDAIVSPAHGLSLAQALRSPIFGATDDDLIALADAAPDGGAAWSDVLAAGSWPQPALRRAQALLAGWREAATTLPPHDLLDRIVAESEVRERLAAAVPAHQRRGALAAVDALLAQSLALDGGRYATPYGFVRALRKRRIAVPAPSHPDAVQLLTVHGAKGLEAQVVFVMDAEPQPPRADSATLLIDWPADQADPRTCAFVYSEARSPASLADLLAEERAMRRREEFNALYVALTRAASRAVFSATQPSAPDREPSWWDRLQAVAAPLPVPAPAQMPAGAADAVLPVLPVAPAAPVVAPTGEADAVARLGQAVHRALEWAAADAAAAPLAELAAGAAAAFGVAAAEVEAIAGRILASPACAGFFRDTRIRWAGNEVALGEGGQVHRIDRLVLREEADGPVWWVLDYKLGRDPAGDPALVEQLRRYRRAVALARPDAVVRSAFITGDGRLVESD